MPTVLMNKLLVRAPLCLFAHVAPLVVYAAAALRSPICTALVPFGVSP